MTNRERELRFVCESLKNWVDNHRKGEHTGEGQEANALVEWAHDVLTVKRRKPARRRVIIGVSGGVAEIEKAAPGVDVIIKDYDNCSECGGVDCNGGHDALRVHGHMTGEDQPCS